jgi:hypothetical protein
VVLENFGRKGAAALIFDSREVLVDQESSSSKGNFLARRWGGGWVGGRKKRLSWRCEDLVDLILQSPYWQPPLTAFAQYQPSTTATGAYDFEYYYNDHETFLNTGSQSFTH